MLKEGQEKKERNIKRSLNNINIFKHKLNISNNRLSNEGNMIL